MCQACIRLRLCRLIYTGGTCLSALDLIKDICIAYMDVYEHKLRRFQLRDMSKPPH